MELDKPPPSSALPSCIVRSVNHDTESTAESSFRGRTGGATCRTATSTFPTGRTRSSLLNLLFFPLLLTLLLSCLPQNTSASPLWYPASIEPRNIRNLPCVSKKTQETGICMFAFSCFKVNGTHLGTCIDRFYFGSCCQLPDSYDPNAIANEILVHETHPSPLRPHPTRRPTINATITSLIGKPTRPSTTARPATGTYTKTTTKPIVTRPTLRPTATKPTAVTGGKPTTATTTKPTTVSNTTVATTAPNKKPPLLGDDQILTTTPKINTSSVTKPTPKPALTRPTSKPTARPTAKPVTRPPIRPPSRPTSKPGASPTIKPSSKPTPSVPPRPISKPTPKPVTKPTAKPTVRPTTNATLRPPLKPSPTKPTSRPSSRPTTKPTTAKPISQQQVSKPPVKPGTPKPTARPTNTTKPTTKPTTQKPLPLKPTVTKPIPPKPTTPKPTTPKPTTPKPTTPKPAAPKPTTAKPTTTQKPSSAATTRPTTSETSEKPLTTVTTTQTPPPNTTVAQSSATTIPSTITTQADTATKGPSTTPETQTQISNEIPPIKPGETSGVQPPEAVEEDTNAIATGGSTQGASTGQGSTPSTVSSTTSGTTLTSQEQTETTVPSSTTLELQTTVDNATSATTLSTSGEAVTTTSSPDTMTTAGPGNEGLNMTNFREVCGRRLVPTSRIVGGAKSTFGKWPWQISLRQWRTSTYLHKCGAALLNENWAITAAHCVENVPPGDLLLRLGEHDLSTDTEPLGHLERRVQLVASHPQFDPRTFEYDLALLRFYEPVTPFAANVLPICVPEDDRSFVGSTAFVTGWGRLYEDGPLPSVLQEVRVPVINNSACEGMYRSAGYVEHIPSIFICAGWRKGGFDSCEGDSGGPMVIQRAEDMRWVLAGVISWGIGCAEPNQPGVYTRISEFRGWINQILQF